MRFSIFSSQKISGVINKTKLFLNKKWNSLRLAIKRGYRWILNLPSWAKHRPAAIKKWLRENKKKRIYHSFKLEKKIAVEKNSIPTSWQLTKQSVQFFLNNFWVFFFVMLIQASLYLAFVFGPTDFNLDNAQETIKALFGGDSTSMAGTLALFGGIIGAQTQREGSAMANFIIYLVVSLALIWIIRQLTARKSFRIRDAFYGGMAPIIPVLLIFCIMFLQLLPFTVASYIYTVGRSSGVFISGIEDLLFFLIAICAGLLSFYLMTPSALSLYAVTLPNMYPLTTIRLTKKIVQFRRFLVFRRVLALPIIIAVFFAVVLLLLIRFLPSGGIWFVQIFPIAMLPLIHIYLFKLYKSLL